MVDYEIFLNERKILYQNGIDVHDKNNYSNLNQNKIELCMKKYNAIHQRKRRYRDRVLKWVWWLKNIKHGQDYELVLIMLSFNDEVLKSTTKDTRRKYVRRYLQKYCYHYLANIDFSPKQREHYHVLALVEKNRKLANTWKWKMDVRKVRLDNNSIKKTFNYVMKVVNHAFKLGTRCESIIYDRNKKSLDIEWIVDSIYDKEYTMFKDLFNNELEEIYSQQSEIKR